MFNALVDTRLSVHIGEPDKAAQARIDDQLIEALRATVGDVLGDGPIDIETVDRIAPWARDLARGLHWQAVRGRSRGEDFDAQAVLDEFATDPLDPAVREDGAATVAKAWALTHDRIVDQIHGHQAHKRYSSDALGRRAPWQDSVFLGHGLHLLLEWLRLDPRVRPLGP